MRALLLVLLLTGCATAEERAYQQRQERRNYIYALQDRCIAYGITEKDPRFPECMMQLDLQVRQEKANRDAQQTAVLMGLAGQYNQAAQPRFVGQPMIRCFNAGYNGFICQ